ncbi:hypothetical protein V6N13_017180 [Hibiscus sabdariffa]
MQGGRHAAVGGVHGVVVIRTFNWGAVGSAGDRFPGGARPFEAALCGGVPRLFNGGEASFLRGLGLVGTNFAVASPRAQHLWDFGIQALAQHHLSHLWRLCYYYHGNFKFFPLFLMMGF